MKYIRTLSIMVATLMAVVFSFKPLTMSGQNLKNFYYSTPTKEGTLYFIVPQDFNIKDKTEAADKKLSYDFTFTSGKDSVRMLMTIKTKKPLETDSLFIQTQNNLYRSGLNTIYKEIKKKLWVNRMELFLKYDTWKDLFVSEMPLVLYIKQHGEEVKYTLPVKRWKELKDKYELFFQMIELNSKKR